MQGSATQASSIAATIGITPAKPAAQVLHSSDDDWPDQTCATPR
jgi:hypothetical protein